jgi:hypothetical protein
MSASWLNLVERWFKELTDPADIIAKVTRGRAALDQDIKSATDH